MNQLARNFRDQVAMLSANFMFCIPVAWEFLNFATWSGATTDCNVTCPKAKDFNLQGLGKVQLGGEEIKVAEGFFHLISVAYGLVTLAGMLVTLTSISFRKLDNIEPQSSDMPDLQAWRVLSSSLLRLT
jgi:hypothetical protein